LLASPTSLGTPSPPNSRGDCLRNAIRTAGADDRPVNSTSTANPASFQLRSCSDLHFYRTFRFDFTRELVFRTTLTWWGSQVRSLSCPPAFARFASYGSAWQPSIDFWRGALAKADRGRPSATGTLSRAYIVRGAFGRPVRVRAFGHDKNIQKCELGIPKPAGCAAASCGCISGIWTTRATSIMRAPTIHNTRSRATRPTTSPCTRAGRCGVCAADFGCTIAGAALA
jgi:hypothetical protein